MSSDLVHLTIRMSTFFELALSAKNCCQKTQNNKDKVPNVTLHEKYAFKNRTMSFNLLKQL